jgi:hypothetical protein
VFNPSSFSKNIPKCSALEKYPAALGPFIAESGGMPRCAGLLESRRPPGLFLLRSFLPSRSIHPPPFSLHDLADEQQHEHLAFQEAPDLVKAA